MKKIPEKLRHIRQTSFWNSSIHKVYTHHARVWTKYIQKYILVYTLVYFVYTLVYFCIHFVYTNFVYYTILVYTKCIQHLFKPIIWLKELCVI